MISPEKPEDRLFALLRHLSTLPLMRISQDLPITTPQIALLSWIERSPGCGVLDIAKGLGLSPPTISVGIHRLIKAGWLERRRDPNDRRARPLYLTQEGEAIMLRVSEHRHQMLKLFFSGLTTAEQEQLINLLEQAVNTMGAALEKEP